MLTLRDILDAVELQGEAKYYYYDYNDDKRVELTEEQAADHEVKYMYPENNVICFEVDFDEET